MLNNSQIFALLFLMLGPFKILGPFVKITKNADAALTRKIAVRAILFSIGALVLAAFLGENILSKYGIPVPILTLSGGIILFLVALLKIIHQFQPTEADDESVGLPQLSLAINPLAFPTIVTPYGIGAVIVFIALSPDLNSKLIVVAIVVGIMLLNLLVMFFARRIFNTLSLILVLLGAVLGVVQVALGAKIIYNALTVLLAS
jgi:multiple antibiotic resistance protein